MVGFLGPPKIGDRTRPRPPGRRACASTRSRPGRCRSAPLLLRGHEDRGDDAGPAVRQGVDVDLAEGVDDVLELRHGVASGSGSSTGLFAGSCAVFYSEVPPTTRDRVATRGGWGDLGGPPRSRANLLLRFPCRWDISHSSVHPEGEGMSEATITLDSRDEAILLFGSRDQSTCARSAPRWACSSSSAAATRSSSRAPTTSSPRPSASSPSCASCCASRAACQREDVKTVLEVVTQGRRPHRHARRRRQAAPTATAAATSGRAPTARPRYVQAMRDHDLTICVGPAGTGKTYLAVGMAVSWLRQASVKKIVLVRPAVEAGERLGFLPGDMVAKVNPYLRPLFDALNDMMEPEQVKRYMENDIIEIVPAGVHARPDAQPGRHHPRRGPEHDGAADEDVPDAHGQRLEDHRHRRRDAGRPAASRRAAA